VLRTADVAKMLDVSEATLRGWRRLGSGPPYIKVGRAVRYRPEDVERWVEERRKDGNGNAD